MLLAYDCCGVLLVLWVGCGGFLVNLDLLWVCWLVVTMAVVFCYFALGVWWLLCW